MTFFLLMQSIFDFFRTTYGHITSPDKVCIFQFFWQLLVAIEAHKSVGEIQQQRDARQYI